MNVRIADICSIKSGKRLPRGTDFADVVTPYPYIRARDIKNGRVNVSDLVYLSEDVQKRIKQYIVETNDVVITIVGASVGDVALVEEKCNGFNLTENAVRLTNFIKTVNPIYVSYLLNSKKYWELMQQIAGGSAQPKLGIYKIESIEIDLPTIELQNKIVSILSAYDDLIENNQKQIKLLEEAAQRLYKEWFVDLRFPGYENTPIVDGVPEGWRKTTIGDTFNTVLGGTPSRSISTYWNGNIPWINSGEVNKLRIIKESEFITELGLEKSSTKLMPLHTTVLAITGATLGQVSYTEIETCANQSVVGIYDENEVYSIYLYLYVSNKIWHMIGKATGGAQQHINKDIVNAYPIVLPERLIISKLNTLIEPYFDKMANLYKQNSELTEARDRLLPKLMSGELEV